MIRAENGDYGRQMMKRLEGRIGIVTGASAGIGAACAHRLAAEGAHVVIADVPGANVRAVVDAIAAEGGRAEAAVLDLAEEASVIALFDSVNRTHGRLDFLHNNAADTRVEQMARDMALIEMEADIWDRAFRVNARGTMLAIKHALPIMIAGGGGSIVNTSSGAALRGDLYGPAYAASKAAINCLTEYTATQYGKQGIRCNTVSPGMIVTENSKSNVPPEQFKRIEGHTLTPYLGVPLDIAAAVAWLVSDDARFVTAQTIRVDGGIISHMPYFSESVGAFLDNPGARPGKL
ncbi:MAG: hypothetical protein JWR77_2204 [Rhizorhabdus sp.]|nr:hypothetical protein [Rhizorhabdus sp.]